MIVLRNSERMALSRTPDVFHVEIVHGDTPISAARALFPVIVILFIFWLGQLKRKPFEFGYSDRFQTAIIHRFLYPLRGGGDPQGFPNCDFLKKSRISAGIQKATE